MTQVESLDDLTRALKPVTALLTSVLQQDDGQLSAAQAARLGGEVKKALAELAPGAPVTPPAKPAAPGASEPVKPTTPGNATKPVRPAKPARPARPATPTKPLVPAPVAGPGGTTVPRLWTSPALSLPGGSVAYDRNPIDLERAAVADLQEKVNILLRAATSGDRAQVAPAVRGVLTGTVNVVTAGLVGGGLPKATLPGLPPLQPSAGAPRPS
ncbi:hypothetical protein ACFZCL_05145 [Streptomyces sp. NPDC008159]|uniref:hypothetical protein n=1 Tax=Streptomyces sp. NPDC008159 TaxID=3364817 RepID=UPI0036E0983D